MPALLLHMTLARQALDRPDAPAAVAVAGRDHPDALVLGSVLPDLPYHAHFLGQLVRHLAGRAYLLSDWGDVFHTRATGRFGLALLSHLDRSHPGPAQRSRLLALAAGYLCHHAVDRVAHPGIQALVAARLSRGEPPVVLHSRIERYQSLLYHLDLLGHDIAGTPVPRRMTAQMAGARSDARLDPALTESLRAACLETHGRSPAAAEVRGWLRGIRSYGTLMSSPLGRRERLDRDGPVEALRSRWYDGPEVDLRRPLEASLELTVRCWQAALQVLDAGRITGHVRSAFLEMVPDVDLGTGA